MSRSPFHTSNSVILKVGTVLPCPHPYLLVWLLPIFLSLGKEWVLSASFSCDIHSAVFMCRFHETPEARHYLSEHHPVLLEEASK